MSKSQDKLKKLREDLDAFLSLPQSERINILQGLILDKVTDESISATELSKLSNALIESTSLRQDNSLSFDKVDSNPEDIRKGNNDGKE